MYLCHCWNPGRHRIIHNLILLSLSLPIRFAVSWSWTQPSNPVNDEITKSSHQNQQYRTHSADLQADEFRRTTSEKIVSNFDVDGHSLAASSSRSNRRSLLDQSRLLEEHQVLPSCWQMAYLQLSSSCRQILRNETLKAHLSIMFTNCFLRSSHRKTIICTEHMNVEMCTKKMSDHEHAVYLAFFLDVEAECHHLQSEAFKEEVENAVNALKVNADWLQGEISHMMEQSKSILDASAESLIVQHHLSEKQAAMAASLRDGFTKAEAAVSGIKLELKEVEKMQRQMVQSQALQEERLELSMETFNSWTFQLSKVMDKQVTGQEQLLAVQTQAAEQMSQMKDLQATAMQDQKIAITELSQLAKVHRLETATWHEEMTSSQANLVVRHKKIAADIVELTGTTEQHHVATRHWYSEMENAHKQLAEGATEIMAAQEEFLVKQAAVFAALDRIFTLCGAIKQETKAMNAILFYGGALLLTYAFTSVPQTRSARLILLLGTCIAFATEMGMFPGQVLLNVSKSFHIRLTLVFGGVIFIILCALSYRDPNVAIFGVLEEQSKNLVQLSQRIEDIVRLENQHYLSSETFETTKRLQNRSVSNPIITKQLTQSINPTEGSICRNKPNISFYKYQRAKNVIQKALWFYRHEQKQEFLAITFEDESELSDPNYTPKDGVNFFNAEKLHERKYNLRPRIR